MSPITCCACSHLMRLPTRVPARMGSSPRYSNVRPLRGSRVIFVPPPKLMLYPCARNSRPISAPYSHAACGSHEAADARLEGSAVEYLPLAALMRPPYPASLI